MPGEFRRRIAERGTTRPALAQKYDLIKSLLRGYEYTREWDVFN
jgi:hypothetical protein